MALRFSALWIAELAGIEGPGPGILADILYVPALWLFASQGPLFALSLGKKAPPGPLVIAVKASALAACLLSILSSCVRDIPGILSALQDSVGIWIPAAFMCAWGLAHRKESLSGPFRSQLIAFLALSAALLAALALSGFGLLPGDFSPFIFSSYGIVLNAAFIAVGASWFLSPPQRADGLPELLVQARGISPREEEVAALILKGMSSRDIAGALFISPRTVESHIASLYRKTGTGSRFELMALSGRPELPPGTSDQLRNPTESAPHPENR
jgi:DNA-binding CsgD family transcriptional regulator